MARRGRGGPHGRRRGVDHVAPDGCAAGGFKASLRMPYHGSVQVEFRKMALKPLLVALVAVTVAWSVHEATGNFADAAGFSGRAGLTCLSCHQPPSPTHNDAKAVLEGLPEAWEPGQSYALQIRVTGGPPAMPSPFPQGGFDIATDLGVLDTQGQADLRQVGAREITYQPEATLRREWRVNWTAPDLTDEPRSVTVWLAVLSANGNHLPLVNRSDLGETLDASDALVATVPPSAAALAAWQAKPLLAPVLHADWTTRILEGQHQDPLATHVAWQWNNGLVERRQTGPEWTLSLAGNHGRLTVWSEGSGRMSLPVVVETPLATQADSDAAPEHTSPGVGALLPLILALILTRRKP